MSFKLTYATMYNPPEELHTRFESALSRIRGTLGARHPLYVSGEERLTAESLTKRNPADDAEVLGEFAAANVRDADDALRAAHNAWPTWKRTAINRRAQLLRRVGELIEERVYDIAAALTLEVGKNRMEALG